MAGSSGRTRTTRPAERFADGAAERAETSEAESTLEVVDPRGLLPAELLVAAAEVAVGRGALVDRPAQLEVAQDRGGPQVEHVADGRGDLRRVDGLGAEGL